MKNIFYTSKVLLDPIYWKDIPLSVRNKPTSKLFKKMQFSLLVQHRITIYLPSAYSFLFYSKFSYSNFFLF